MKYLAFGLTLETTLDFAGWLQVSDRPTDVRVVTTAALDAVDGVTRLRRRGIQATFGTTPAASVLEWGGVARFAISNGDCVAIETLGADDATLRLFLLSEVIGVVLFQRGLFLLHGSAVQTRAGAVLFLGTPGAGKSTTAAACALAGHTVLTDDLVAIELRGGQPYVVPAFAHYKVWASALRGLGIDASQLTPSSEGVDKYLVRQPLAAFPTQAVPLTRVYAFATDGDPPGALPPTQVPLEFLKHFPLPAALLDDAVPLRAHFDGALRIAAAVPVLRMIRPRGFDALQTFVTETAGA